MSSPQQRESMSLRPKRVADMTPEDRYGMAGLMAIINPESLDYNELSLGVDVTTLGLNLDSTE
jgi:CCR4-NOT transcription complex subunit 2